MRAIADHLIVLPPPPPSETDGKIILPAHVAKKSMLFYYGLVLYVGPKVTDVKPMEMVIFDQACARMVAAGGVKHELPIVSIFEADVFLAMDIENANERGFTIPDIDDDKIKQIRPVFSVPPAGDAGSSLRTVGEGSDAEAPEDAGEGSGAGQESRDGETVSPEAVA